VGFAEDLAAAAKGAVCGFLQNGGNATLGTFVVRGLMTPGGQVPAAAAGLGLLALNYGCSFDPDGFPSGSVDGVEGCTKVASGGMILYRVRRSDGFLDVQRGIVEVLRSYGCGPGCFAVDVKTDTGNIHTHTIDTAAYSGFKTVLEPGSVCADGSGGGLPPPFVWPPTHHHTTDSGCVLNVDFDSWLLGEDGKVKPVLKISSGGGPGALAAGRAGGGIIGGCNFAPIVYVGDDGGGGGPPWWAPWVDTPPGPDGKPWWWDLLIKGATGLVDAVFEKWIEDLLQPTLPEVKYTLASVCELDSEGLPVQRFVERTIPAGKGLPAIAQRIDMLQFIAQGLKDFKQPVCARDDTRPVFTGEEVTVRFESKEISPYSTTKLRKNFRYRRQNGTDLLLHARAWWNFEWRSGSCQVMSRGLSWGRPQVWASTEAEGKRVIRWAAGLSGVNLEDPRHSWQVNWTSDPRIGVEMDMATKILRSGEPWVTERMGADGPSVTVPRQAHDP
jgi:hypothetical protein